MHCEMLHTEGHPRDGKRIVLFVASDGEEAKAVVSGLIEEIGFEPIDPGSLKDSHKQQPGSPIYNEPMSAKRARELLADMN